MTPGRWEPEEVRFWRNVKADESTGCWLWTGQIGSNGYARFHRDTRLVGRDKRVVYAHRWVWEYRNGELCDGHEVDHLCRNRACVNPSHLEAVTKRENILRSSAPPADNARKTHCKNGHPFTPENTYIEPKRGARSCRACNLAAVKRHRARSGVSR